MHGKSTKVYDLRIAFFSMKKQNNYTVNSSVGEKPIELGQPQPILAGLNFGWANFGWHNGWATFGWANLLAGPYLAGPYLAGP